MNPVLASCARGGLWCSVVLICMLTFVWPFAVSSDPGQPAFRIGAIAVLAPLGLRIGF